MSSSPLFTPLEAGVLKLQHRVVMAPLTRMHPDLPSTSELFRPYWPGVLIAAGGYDPSSAEKAVASGQADAIAFGRLFIANPDLVDRVRTGAALSAWDRSTFYGGGEAGYTDYSSVSTVG
jgi:N-ethylmaleimide reductase